MCVCSRVFTYDNFINTYEYDWLIFLEFTLVAL